MAVRDDAHLRLMVRVARLYHEQGLRQSEIADQLHLSQARVSRLLKEAQAKGIVRTIVTVPSGMYAALEDGMRDRYGLADCVVVDADDADPTSALGSAAAGYLQATLGVGERLGISSWSATLLAMAEALPPGGMHSAEVVVQLVGGHGDPRVQVRASRLLGLLADRTGGEPVSLPAPGMLGAAAARDSLAGDASVAPVMALWPGVTTALVGIGTPDQSPLLRESGNGLTQGERTALRAAGGVGDICLRFYDADGEPLSGELAERVIGIDLAALKGIPRRLAIAGGSAKRAAIRGALRGGLATVLITDRRTAEGLLGEAVAPTRTAGSRR